MVSGHWQRIGNGTEARTVSADHRRELVRQGTYVAADLEERGYPLVGIVRQLAREVAGIGDTGSDDGCAGCGTELVQPWTGRRRRWCSETCRRRKRP